MKTILTLFCAFLCGLGALPAQSLLQSRCIRTNAIPVKKIAAYRLSVARDVDLSGIDQLVESEPQLVQIDSFNAKGQLVQTKKRDQPDEAFVVSACHYENGRLSAVERRIHAEPFEGIRYSYLEKGRTKVTTTNLRDSLLTDTYFTQQDEHGNLISNYRLNADGDTLSIRHSRYDEHDRLIYLASYLDGRLTSSQTILRNPEGNRFRSYRMKASGQMRVVDTVEEEGPAGLLQERSTTFEAGVLIETTIAQLDAFGNVEQFLLDNPSRKELVLWIYHIDYE